MSLVQQIPGEVYMKKRHVQFLLEPHVGTETAVGEARVLGIPPKHVLKVVMLRVDQGFLMAVVPSSRRVDLRAVRDITGSRDIRLATEGEIMKNFPDFDLGALPPMPGLLGIRGCVDQMVFEDEEVVFADGKRTESMVADPRELFWGEDVYVAPISREPWMFEGDGIFVADHRW